MIEKILEMKTLQENNNLRVSLSWKENNFSWERAIRMEIFEMIEHWGWKWWMKQEKDISQIKLELVDIWHFALSEIIELDKLSDEEIKTEFNKTYHVNDEDFIEICETMISNSITENKFDFTSFVKLMKISGLSFSELYCRYIGKNILNEFRQKNGYKEGSYIKIWEGEEDNYHMIRFFDSLDIEKKDFKEKLYSMLETKYSTIKNID